MVSDLHTVSSLLDSHYGFVDVHNGFVDVHNGFANFPLYSIDCS